VVVQRVPVSVEEDEPRAVEVRKRPHERARRLARAQQAPERCHHDPAKRCVRPDERPEAAFAQSTAHTAEAAEVEDRRRQTDRAEAGRILDQRERHPAPVAGADLGERPDLERLADDVQHRASLHRRRTDLGGVPLRDEAGAVTRAREIEPDRGEPLRGEALRQPRRQRGADRVVPTRTGHQEDEPARAVLRGGHDRGNPMLPRRDEDRELSHAAGPTVASPSAQAESRSATFPSSSSRVSIRSSPASR
jgi:hypothetical protein